MLLELIDGLSAKITELDERIEAHLENVPGLSGACMSYGQRGPDGPCTGCGEPVLGVLERLDQITGIGRQAAQVIIAELGTDMTQFPTPGHAASWAKLTPRAIQSGGTSKTGRRRPESTACTPVCRCGRPRGDCRTPCSCRWTEPPTRRYRRR